MVTTRTKRWGTFSLFVLPALILYIIFAIVPLIMGTWLSTTNWDGVSPWVPVQIPIERFENEIMPSLNSSQQEFLSRFYIRDDGQGTYRKQETHDNNLRGFRKYKAMRIFAAAGYVNPTFRFVGLQN